MSHSVFEEVVQHYFSFFEGHKAHRCEWDRGPMPEAIPEFHVLRFEPGPRIGLWTYCSVGASSITHEDAGKLEFLIHSEREDPRLVELLTMVAYFHRSTRLGLGHTLTIGEPWLPGSSCDYFLISLPYPLGPEIEICHLEDGQDHAHVHWLLPITKAERDFKAANDVEALEQAFEEHKIEFWKIDRRSVI
jgi:hypothetical protein